MNTDLSSIKIENGNALIVNAVSESIFRVRISADGKFRDSGLSRYGILKTDWPECTCDTRKKTGTIELQTAKATLAVSLADGSVTLKNEKGIVLDQKDAPVSDRESGSRLAFRLDATERLFGLGDENRECVSKRGHKARMVVTNVATYEPMPFVMSTRGWGLFLNTTWYHYADLGATDRNTAVFSSEKGTLDYFLFVGDSLRELLSVYTEIAGRPALLPKWGYGMTFVCDEREFRARDMLYEAYEFRRHEVPCDVIGLEPGWMEKHYDFSVDKKWSDDRFHIPVWLKDRNFGKFTDALRNMGFKMSLWLCCDYDLSEYEEMLIKGKDTPTSGPTADESVSMEDNLIKDPHFVPRYMDDVTKRGEPWFKHLEKFVDDGASAFKLDGANSVCFHPDRKWMNGMEDAEMHNLYPVLYVKQMADGYQA
ncbi:MAG: TIM-barrel domain-containing protein, partial [Spirochaetota bacterium]